MPDVLYCERGHCYRCDKGPIYLYAKGLCAYCHWEEFGTPRHVGNRRQVPKSLADPAHIAELAERAAKGESLFKRKT